MANRDIQIRTDVSNINRFLSVAEGQKDIGSEAMDLGGQARELDGGPFQAVIVPIPFHKIFHTGGDGKSILSNLFDSKTVRGGEVGSRNDNREGQFGMRGNSLIYRIKDVIFRTNTGDRKNVPQCNLPFSMIGRLSLPKLNSRSMTERLGTKPCSVNN